MIKTQDMLLSPAGIAGLSLCCYDKKFAKADTMEQYLLFISLGGLLIFTLLMASVVKYYQQQMAEKRLKIQRVLRGVDLVEGLLSRVAGCSFPAELETLLRRDILDRYQQVKKIHRRYGEIDTLLESAEHNLSQIVTSRKIEIADMGQLTRITSAYTEAIGYLSEGWMVSPLTQEQVSGLVEMAATRRAEAVRAYHLQQANDLREADDLRGAAEHCYNIKSFLREQGPDNDQAIAWYKEAEELRMELVESMQTEDSTG
jgi:hypothetical protein